MPAVWVGMGWHLVGAFCAASFYAPIEKVKQWTWETTWAIAGVFSWVVLPIGVSLLLLPDFRYFYASLGTSLLLRVAFFGALWGIGNVSYGLTMRHLGMSIGIGIAIGITLVVGTMAPPLLHGQFAQIFESRHGLWTVSGVLVALLGVTIVSYAGHQKELQLRGEQKEFNLKLGLLLAVLCGIFSSGMSFALDAAGPIAAAAIKVGVKPLYSSLPAYVIIMGGGGVVNLCYCFLRLGFKRDLSLRNDLAQPSSTLAKNGGLAAAGGIMWYLQFFFYAWGAANIPIRIAYVNWMLHMSLYVLCGAAVGLAVGEWKGVSTRPLRLLWAGMLVIVVAANLVGMGAR